jgi:hypothetical protein
MFWPTKIQIRVLNLVCVRLSRCCCRVVRIDRCPIAVIQYVPRPLSISVCSISMPLITLHNCRGAVVGREPTRSCKGVLKSCLVAKASSTCSLVYIPLGTGSWSCITGAANRPTRQGSTGRGSKPWCSFYQMFGVACLPVWSGTASTRTTGNSWNAG